MPITTTPSERIGRCTRMRRFFVRFNRPESFVHTRSSAGFTIITSGFEFSVHTADDCPLLALSLLPADAQLVFDRRIALIVGGIAGIQGNAGHRRLPLHPYAINGAPRCSCSVEPVRGTWL